MVGLQPFSSVLSGLFFLCSAVGSCSVARIDWESPFGAEKPEEGSCPFYFGAFAAATSGHIASENIVADTQQDDLLAVIHGESSQTGLCSS